MKRIKYILPLALLAMMGTSIISCDDMLDMGNDDVLYADENHLTQGTDTVNSFVGILAQLQKIAVRTNLYGELRGDLVVVNNNANADLKAISNFEVTDSNAYNNPRDYYSVINNCNYYLANADTTLMERRYDATTLSAYDFRVFQAEYCAVRAIRAWVYLQLAQVYGDNIPLVTEPILSLDDANDILEGTEKKSFEQICDYFIEDLKPYVSWFAYPYHHDTYGYSMPARMAVMPIQLVLGDLYLWSASLKGGDAALAGQAAKCYYDYISWLPTELGVDNNTGYKQKTVTTANRTYWLVNNFITSNFNSFAESNAYWSTTSFGTANSEVISAIAMDSLASEDNYNALRVLYNYDRENENVEASIAPSQVCCDYSDSQVYGQIYNDGSQLVFGFVPKNVLNETMVARHYVGDLRLAANLSLNRLRDNDWESQTIWKTYMAQDVIVYRTGQVYLRMAEALNMAGYPKFALAILTVGLDNTVIENEVLRECNTKADSTFVQYFDFPSRFFKTRVLNYTIIGTDVTVTYHLAENAQDVNQIGIHARGSGFYPRNPFYYDPSNDIPADLTLGGGYPVQPPVYVQAVTSFIDTAKDLPKIVDANTDFFAWAYEHDGIEILNLEDYPTTGRLEVLRQFDANMKAYSDSIQGAWVAAANEWYHEYGLPQVHARQLVVVDSLLDVESALETPFEGFRFGRLMRAAYRSGNPGAYMAEKIGRRDPNLTSVVSDPKRWFINFKGQIGR